MWKQKEGPLHLGRYPPTPLLYVNQTKELVASENFEHSLEVWWGM
jgi:hypothetical protein